MNPGRLRGALSLPKTLLFILAGIILLSFLFFTFWQQLNRKVEETLKDQFNRQQLELARKIADNIESYFDFLESELLAFPGRFRLLPPESPGFNAYMADRFQNLRQLGILEIRWYDSDGRLRESWGRPENADPPGPGDRLDPGLLAWANHPDHKGHLYLGLVHKAAHPPWQGRLIMPMATALYATPEASTPYGVLVIIINPLYIAGKVTEGVRSGATGYAWIIDQDGVLLAHYEKSFIGEDALEVRQKRNPAIVFRGLKEIHERLFRGEEGMSVYVSGWHRQKVAEIEKLAAFTPIRFDKGLIRGVTDVADPTRNLWGVALAAPVEEVSGAVRQITHQELFLVALFALALLLGTVSLITVSLNWNKVLAREVKLKTEELLDSQERLLRSERFAAVGESAAYVSHEIKNPLMVIGGLARQVEKKVDEPGLKEKLHIIQAEVQRLENFLGDLRDFTRPATPVKQKIDINKIIHEVDALMAEEAKNQGVILEEHLDPKVPPLQADPNQMKQVLLNLMKNAFEALDSGGKVILSSGCEDNRVWFSVQDTGMGMSPEVLKKIFNPFFTTKKKGSGLGLAVINKIVGDHHGTVSVESAPDKGTTFRVDLPLGS